MEPTQLSNLVEEMARLLETGAPASTRFIYELDEAVPPVEADESQLSQVVMNLITNATEAVGGDRGGEVTIRCGAVRPSREDLVRAFLGEALTPGLFSYIEVCDNGSGIDAETRGRIFDPFFTTKFTGRGLGLAAVLGIVRSHRGGIEIESEPGVGTRFRVIFPAARDLELPAGGETESRPIENWQTHGVALVVDDDQAVREFAEDTLLRAGFSVLSAADGREGIETFRKHAERIRVVILDRTMPAIGGEEAFDAMRHNRRETPVILLSGHLENRAAEKFIREDLAGFVKKPFLPTTLLRAVRDALEG